MKKKAISILLAASMLMAAFTGCGNQSAGVDAETSQEGSVAETAQTESGEMPNIVVGWSWVEVPADLDMVEEAINEITKEKIGCTVTLNAYTYSNISQQMQMTLATPSEQLDALCARLYGVGINSFISKGQFRPLNALLDEYGQGVKEALGEEVLEANEVNGEVYGITPTGELAGQYCLVVRSDILKAVGFEDLKSVEDYDELTALFEAIHKAYPELNVVAAGAPQSSYTIGAPSGIDGLNDNYGVLMDINNPTISNYYESDRYKEICKLGREWNKAGYVYPDILTDPSNGGDSLMKQGLLASMFHTYKPGKKEELKVSTGYDCEIIPIGTPLATAGLTWQWAIPQNAVYPEYAMKFINLLYTDADLINLFNFGIPDYHYALDENGRVIPGEHIEGYSDQKKFETGNLYLSHKLATEPDDIYDQMKAWNASAKVSVARGFTFDAGSVATEYTALQSVKTEYDVALQWGFYDDIDGKIKEFNDALYEAGLQKYMDTKQEALNAWLDTKKAE